MAKQFEGLYGLILSSMAIFASFVYVLSRLARFVGSWIYEVYW